MCRRPLSVVEFAEAAVAANPTPAAAKMGFIAVLL